MNRLECRGEVVETHVGRPSAQRDRAQAGDRRVDAASAHPALLREAEEVYERYAARAVVDSPTSPGDGTGNGARLDQPLPWPVRRGGP